MKRAGRGRSRSLGVSGTILSIITVFLTVLLVWREHGHAQTAAAIEGNRQAIQVHLEETRQQLAMETERASRLQAKLHQQETVEESLRDRISNLEAQRDHLRADAERQGMRASELESTLARTQSILEEERLKVLQLGLLPDKLSGDLRRASMRIEQLEGELDKQAGRLAGQPLAYLFDGVSNDGTVFSLQGELSDTADLPIAVHLCRKNGLILDGWISRQEDQSLIGHVAEWHLAASTLVKGEKVFILPKKSHESHR